ncbi:MAG: rubredoxin-NAD(+) reductase [Gammaproteobacteria bacterium]|nr:MAG: rubredoxin-NAD(+) reductase [Gammaproteobacteria bacterium]PHR83685.1 MAG: rubredoxin-NAD(+) reductase [Colwellia sp.]
MKTWLCIICGLIYDERKGWPDDGIAPGTRWEDVPDDWLCPDCQVGKEDFEMLAIFDDNEAATTVAISSTESIAALSTESKTNTIVGPERIVIIGSGHAGYHMANALREQDKNVSITVFTSDDGALYSKPMLSNAFKLGKTAQDLVSESALAWEQRLNIRVYPHTEALKIDRQTQTLTTSIGEAHYDRLVLATGAAPIRIPVTGDADSMLSVNDLSDYAKFRAKITDAKHITILGDGLIGCEFANDLAGQGIKVTVVGLASWPMAALLPQQAGETLQHALSQLGIEWRLQQSIQSISTNDHGYNVTLSDGEVITTDLVLSAVGLRPNTQLAQQSGLDTARGISVDLCHQTSDPQIFAVGDCAEVGGKWAPYIAPINQAKAALVQSILGQPVPATIVATPIIVKTPAMPLCVMPAIADGEWKIDQQTDGLTAGCYDPQGQLLGFVLLGQRQQNERSQWLSTFNKYQAA